MKIIPLIIIIANEIIKRRKLKKRFKKLQNNVYDNYITNRSQEERLDTLYDTVEQVRLKVYRL